jgi:hypothetical protein
MFQRLTSYNTIAYAANTVTCRNQKLGSEPAAPSHMPNNSCLVIVVALVAKRKDMERNAKVRNA